MNAEDLRRYRIQHREVLRRVAEEAPPPPPAALELARATGCPTIRPTPLRAAS